MVSEGLDNRLAARMNVQLAVDIGRVPFYRYGRNKQSIRDFLVAESLGE
nr:hypothetical protein [Desulfosarcina cetonica]